MEQSRAVHESSGGVFQSSAQDNKGTTDNKNKTCSTTSVESDLDAMDADWSLADIVEVRIGFPKIKTIVFLLKH